ncbi:MAG: multiheme c-type cytochrome, partial [Myxococcota bacterium]
MPRLLICLFIACSTPSAVQKAPLDPEVPGTANSEANARLPSVPDAAVHPSHAQIAGNADLLTDVETCRSCHADVVASWERSPHARSSFENPWYRVGVEAFAEARGQQSARFCGGCHDPVPLALNAFNEPADPESWTSHAGVTCLVCHSTRRTSPDGNGSYALDLSDVPIPDPNVPAEVQAHVQRVRPLDGAALCGSCHRSFAGEAIEAAHHLDGIDDVGAWRASAFS